MYKLRATILKDLRLLFRDKVGVIFMFVMPIILAVVITAVQNSTFQLVNDNKVPLILANRDNGQTSLRLIDAIKSSEMFDMKQVKGSETDEDIIARMHAKDALVAIIIPAGFSAKVKAKSKKVAANALKDFEIKADKAKANYDSVLPVHMYYHPVLQESFRMSVRGTLRGALQLVESKEILQNLYFELNNQVIPDNLEKEIIKNNFDITETPVSRDGSRTTPNATQHNIPAWTIFAMFFIVISLGSSVVREKLSGSFVRLKTMPTSFVTALLSKQITFVFVTLLQAAVIFALGIWLFPYLGLPALNLPSDLGGLFVVSLMSGWCAVSFAIFLGVFAQTQEQVNGIGAVSIVLLAAIGGLLVPSFAMPASFQLLMRLSPLHWCLEAFYGLFLEGGTLKDIIRNIFPLFVITILIQLITLWGLKRQQLI